MKNKWNYLKIVILIFIIQVVGFCIYVSIEEKTSRDMYYTSQEIQVEELVSIEELKFDSEYLKNLGRKIDTDMKYYLVELKLYNNEIDSEYIPYFNALDQDNNYLMLESIDYYGDDYYLESGGNGERIPGKSYCIRKYILGIYGYYDETETVSIGKYNYESEELYNGITFELK